ncbi:MAG: DUF2169 domain-containing protein [Polyangiaceae bacterium]|nr:DUF2169 domain-containing protein [Polyangiaceae bacterium]
MTETGIVLPSEGDLPSLPDEPVHPIYFTVAAVVHPSTHLRLLACVARRTYQYSVAGKVTVSDIQQPLTVNPILSSISGIDALATLEDDTDLVAPKEVTDIVVKGTAFSRQKTKEFYVALALGNVARRLRILGERRVEVAPDGTVRFTPAEGFDRLALSPRDAYGGYDQAAQDKIDPPPLHNYYLLGHKPVGIFAYPRNSAGTGYFIDIDRERANGARLPRIEDPLDPLLAERFFVPLAEAWMDAPIPALTGWLPHASYPRLVRYVGDRLPHLPPQRKIREIDLGCGDDLAELKPLGQGEIHPRALQGASPGFARERLRGDELCILQNLDEKAEEVRFSLPGEAPRFGLTVPDIKKVFGPKPVLQTVRIDTDRREFSLTWCATIPLAGRPMPEFFDQCELGVEWGRL